MKSEVIAHNKWKIITNVITVTVLVIVIIN